MKKVSIKKVSIKKIENLCKEIIEKIDKTNFVKSYDIYYFTKRFDDYHTKDSESHIYKYNWYFNISHAYFSIMWDYKELDDWNTKTFKIEIKSYEMKKYFIYDEDALYKMQEILDFYLRKINDNIKNDLN